MVQVWSALSGETRLVYRGHTDQVNEVSWSPNGKLIASSGDGSVQVWDAQTGRLLFKNANSVYGTAWSPDSSRLAFAGTSGLVEAWEMSSGQPPITFSMQGLAAMQKQWLCLDWSHDGRHLAAGGY